jgi:hypothetical protein
MSFIGVNPETDSLEELEVFLIAHDKGDLYLLRWKEDHDQQQYEGKVRFRVNEYLKASGHLPSA